MLYGRWDEHVPAPYQAFREALNDYARACPDAVLRRDLAGLAEEIARLCPEPAHRVGASAAPPQAAAEAERFRLFESLDTWIGRIAARHPVLLVLDDLQWADQPSFCPASAPDAGQALDAAADGGHVPRHGTRAERVLGRPALAEPRHRLPARVAARA